MDESSGRSEDSSSSGSRGDESSGARDTSQDVVAAHDTGSYRRATLLSSKRPGATSRSSRGESYTSTTSSNTSGNESGADVASSNFFKTWIGSFRKQPREAGADPEKPVELHERVDAGLLAAVEEYDPVPPEAASYGHAFFWDKRYASDEEVVEWYYPWRDLAPTLTRYMDKLDEVLVCGCGNSEMSIDMFHDGFERITSVDASRVVIHQMCQTYKAYPVEWKSLDLTREAFLEERFDVALDKACLDSIICNPNGESMAESYLQQMDRILQPEGAFLCISLAPPEERLEVLEYWDLDMLEKCLAWDVYVDAIAKPAELKKGRKRQPKDGDLYFIYVCIKDPGKTEQKKLAKERLKREHEKRLTKM